MASCFLREPIYAQPNLCEVDCECHDHDLMMHTDIQKKVPLRRLDTSQTYL
jgi:hypothetical protein